ncbi:MAG: adenylate/guanylate cyclase protein [Actinotalea sp.]|nr:adenylate/guanylate cyclase protein [Actinotalea sp.]
MPEDPGREDSTLARVESHLLGGPRTLTLRQVAERAGVDVEDVRLYWHALGLPTDGDDVAAFTEQDAALVARSLRARDDHDISAGTSVSLVRAIGHTTDRLVLWQVEALVEHMAERYSLDDTSARLLLLDRLDGLAPLLEAQLVHAWRRQLAAIAGRFAEELGASRTTSGSDELPLARAVGFADVVAFTSRTAGLGSHALADFVQDFETRVRDAVTSAGGRVVKTIGDAVLFVADDPVTGAEVGLGLAEALGIDSPSPVRVGLVWGRVLSRFGDVFGPSVNVAARLTAAAQAGTVLVDAATAALLAESEPSLVLVEQPELDAAGVGRLQPVLVHRGTAGPGTG